jgi:F0F1-type ATP synthase assembly protein I
MAPRQDPGNPWAGMSTGLAISVTMLAGPVVWGLIGYLIDRLAGTGKVFTAIGMVLGAAGAGYIVYLRYGRENDEPKGRNGEPRR